MEENQGRIHEIAHVYEAGDPLFLFGFSRGAYTARSLAGMIAACGLPTKNFTDELVDTAFSAYRDKNNRAALLQTLTGCDMYPAKITMVGVWDTVGSLGIPSAIGASDPILYGFLDTGLNPAVLNAYHALAIDEKRAEFPPTLWKGPAAPEQTVEQVWFCGVHSDVGGGEPHDLPGTTALSDITLTWMMSKASALGLQMQKQYAVPLDPKYSLDTLHTSWKLLFGFPRVRSIDPGARCGIRNGVDCGPAGDGAGSGALDWRRKLKTGMSLDDYKVVLYRNQPEGWVAEIPAIQGCYALMATREEALSELERVFEMIAAEYRDNS